MDITTKKHTQIDVGATIAKAYADYAMETIVSRTMSSSYPDDYGKSCILGLFSACNAFRLSDEVMMPKTRCLHAVILHLPGSYICDRVFNAIISEKNNNSTEKEQRHYTSKDMIIDIEKTTRNISDVQEQFDSSKDMLMKWAYRVGRKDTDGMKRVISQIKHCGELLSVEIDTLKEYESDYLSSFATANNDLYNHRHQWGETFLDGLSKIPIDYDDPSKNGTQGVSYNSSDSQGSWVRSTTQEDYKERYNDDGGDRVYRELTRAFKVMVMRIKELIELCTKVIDEEAAIKSITPRLQFIFEEQVNEVRQHIANDMPNYPDAYNPAEDDIYNALQGCGNNLEQFVSENSHKFSIQQITTYASGLIYREKHDVDKYRAIKQLVDSSRQEALVIALENLTDVIPNITRNNRDVALFIDWFKPTNVAAFHNELKKLVGEWFHIGGYDGIVKLKSNSLGDTEKKQFDTKMNQLISEKSAKAKLGKKTFQSPQMPRMKISS